MTQSFGYYGLPLDNSLIADISESFGDGAPNMSETDTLWLIYRISYDLWMSDEDTVTSEAKEVASRLYELSPDQKIALLKALINS